MCGILCTINMAIEKDVFMDGLRLMTHRGPDAFGYFSCDGVQFGHNRLKILDLDDRSNQPFFSSDGNYVIIFNGEIYNYRELASEKGLHCRTTSDTEVLVELYAKYGARMLSWLNGMFAFVIFDRRKKELFIARDRLGIKPLYWLKMGEKLIVSSEINAIRHIWGKVTIDKFALRQYRKMRTFFNDRTLYKEIQVFPAAHYFEQRKINAYWDLPEGEQSPPSDDELYALIASAVKYRCLSDVPVGSYLSGGLDSTIVAGLADKPDTWTVGFMEMNEFSWGRIAAKNFEANHTEVLVDIADFKNIAKRMIAIRREPLSVPNEVLLYAMTQKVKERNTVVLSGEGADELFFGYDRIFRWAADNVWDIRQFAQLYSYGSHDDMDVVEDALSPYLGRKTALDKVAAFFQKGHLHGLLRRLDNATMLCSVEARVPFVDHRLIDRLAGVPFAYRMEMGLIKAPLKRIFNALVPQEIINREKVAFPVPLMTIFDRAGEGATPMDAWLAFNIENMIDN